MSGSRNANRTRRATLAVLWMAAVLGLAASPRAVAAAQETGDTPSGTAEESSLWDEVTRLYESAREAGERVPRDVAAWVQEDLKSVGDWEYKIVEMATSDATAVEAQLNTLGEDRWECIWIEAREDGARFIFKRPSRAYLQHIPLGDLIKLLPGGGPDAP